MQSVASFLSRWSPSLADRALSTGLDAYKSGEHARAFTEFRVLANRGNATAQAMLGRMYYKGQGTSVNVEEAARWIRLAAEEGVPDAQFSLGVIYENGNGVSQNILEALRWYRRAAQWGLADAQINLSHCFHKGVGVDQDEFLAAWWVSLAAEQGDIDAQLNLGTRYQNGIGVTQDFMEAYIWFDLAANLGSTDAINYRTNVSQELTPEQIKAAQDLSRELNRKPKSAGDSALQVFKAGASQTIDWLKKTLGEDRFAQLRTTEREIPSIGKVILEESHGIKQNTIAKNIKHLLSGLERNLDLNLSTVDNLPDLPAKTAVAFIRRIDDLADVGTVLGEGAADFTHNLLEYHLSLIGALDDRIDLDTLTMLLKRFSLRQALRAPVLVRYAGLHNVVLPLFPW